MTAYTHWNNVAKVGVELEGGDWPDGRNTQGWREDVSVQVDTEDCGEVASPPYKSKEGLQRWIGRNWPKSFDESCGFHVHCSFNSVNDYAKLLDPGVTGLLRERFWDWRETKHVRYLLNDRLAGGNRFCQPHFYPQQVYYEEKHNRYTQLNYCFSLRGTLECRVFPMFPDGPSVAFKAVETLISLYDDWLISAVQELIVCSLSIDESEIEEVL